MDPYFVSIKKLSKFQRSLFNPFQVKPLFYRMLAFTFLEA